MEQLKASFIGLIRDERGVTVIEYGLVAAFVSVTIITSATYYGSRISEFLLAAAGAINVP